MFDHFFLVGRHRKSKSRRGRLSSDSNGSNTGVASTLSSTSTSSRPNDRSTSSSSGENIVAVSYQSETSDLDSRRESCQITTSNERLHEETEQTLITRNESLRWSAQPENEDEEDDRIRIYKMNRRKRYMDVLHHRHSHERENQFYA